HFRIELSEFDDITLSNRTIKPIKLKSVNNTEVEVDVGKINYKYEAFQFILKAQVKILILKKHFPKEYASLWILFINSNSSNNEELLSDITKREDEEWIKLRKEPFFQKYENVFFNEFIKDTRTIPMNDSVIMRYLVVILYLGCIWLRMPILISDFHYWLCHEEIPYNTAVYCVPESILKKISKLDHLIFKPKVI
ncbi:hypothetical protein PIROE2DRAFT_13723, partial [Piromyces sp. E2]